MPVQYVEQYLRRLSARFEEMDVIVAVMLWLSSTSKIFTIVDSRIYSTAEQRGDSKTDSRTETL